ncbi:unnamed protein product [Trichobilharzia regenti]|nr:unnamed protein product [Trichobilharzia regenti]
MKAKSSSSSGQIRSVFAVSLSFAGFLSLLVFITRRLPSLPDSHHCSIAVGASLCYLLVGFIGSKVITHLFPEKIEICRQTLSMHADCVQLPLPSQSCLHPVASRVVPLSLVFIKAGTVLQELTDLGVASLTSFSTLLILAGLSILPLVFRNQLRGALL